MSTVPEILLSVWTRMPHQSHVLRQDIYLNSPKSRFIFPKCQEKSSKVLRYKPALPNIFLVKNEPFLVSVSKSLDLIIVPSGLMMPVRPRAKQQLKPLYFPSLESTMQRVSITRTEYVTPKQHSSQCKTKSTHSAPHYPILSQVHIQHQSLIGRSDSSKIEHVQLCIRYQQFSSNGWSILSCHGSPYLPTVTPPSPRSLLRQKNWFRHWSPCRIRRIRPSCKKWNRQHVEGKNRRRNCTPSYGKWERFRGILFPNM